MELDRVDLNRPEKRSKPKHRPEALGLMAVEQQPSTGSRTNKPERIGHVLMTGDTKPKPAMPEGRTVENMNRTQLLSLSEKIKIDGSSLRQIYETHLIGERGLRHLVAEFMRDGDIKQALRNEIIERERDFERDPAMRHLSDEVSDDPVQSRTTLEELLTKADVASEQHSAEAAFFKARARFEAQELQQHKSRRRVIDISLAALISILVGLIILLLLRRN